MDEGTILEDSINLFGDERRDDSTIRYGHISITIPAKVFSLRIIRALNRLTAYFTRRARYPKIGILYIALAEMGAVGLRFTRRSIVFPVVRSYRTP
jgi:hypothetical protein